MATLFVRHRVRDYAVWRKGYDAHQPKVREDSGSDATVHQSVDDEHDITVTVEFHDRKAAEKMKTSNELRNAMKGAGVEGTPQIWITETR